VGPIWQREEERERQGGLVGPASGAGDLGPWHGHGPGGLLSFSIFFCSDSFSLFCFLFLP
jgi:hypothetical protein